MSNNRNERVKDGKDVKKYLAEMFRNAERHGITLQYVVFKAYRVGHGVQLNEKIIDDEVDEIIEDTKLAVENIAVRSLLGEDNEQD